MSMYFRISSNQVAQLKWENTFHQKEYLKKQKLLHYSLSHKVLQNNSQSTLFATSANNQ